MKALIVLGLAVAPAAAADTLDADLAAMRKANAWPVRASLVGWTADHRAVYRSLICDPDAGGGRGPYCDLELCVAAAGVAFDACTPLASLDLNAGEPVRNEVSRAVVVEKTSGQLATLCALEPGKPLATSTFRTTVGKGVFAIERTGAANPKDRVTVATYLTPEAAEAAAERPQSVSDPKVTAVSTSADGSCVAVLGRYRRNGHYEALATISPYVFAKVICAAAPPAKGSPAR